MQPKLEWRSIFPPDHRGRKIFCATSGDVELRIWECPAGWWMQAKTVADALCDCEWHFLYEDALVQPATDVVNVMIRCETRAREALMGQFGELITTSRSAARGE